GAVAADHPVRDRVALERDPLLPLHVLLGVLGRLLDGRRHLVGLAVARRDAALAVPDHDEGVEAEAPAALDHGSTAADLDDPVLQPVLAVIAISVSLSCHVTLLPVSGKLQFRSELQPALARALGQGLDPAVVAVVASVERHLVDAGGP